MKVISFLLLLSACASHQEKPDPIRDVFLAKKEKYRQCYLESESYTKKLSGVMKIWVFVNADGSVKEAKVLESDFKDPNFKACIEEQLRNLRFVPHDKGHTLDIKQPIRFHPEGP